MAKRSLKKFTPKASNLNQEPIEFEIYDETFEAHPVIQGAVILEFITATASTSEDKTSSALTAHIIPFFKATLVPESYERFNSLITSHDRIVIVEDLMEILAWLIGEYTARPTSGSGN